MPDVDYAPLFYSEGVATFTNGSDLVNGTFTEWDTAVRKMDFVLASNGLLVPTWIKEVISRTQIRISAPWAAATQTNVRYVICRWNNNADIRSYQIDMIPGIDKIRMIPPNLAVVLANIAGLYDQVTTAQGVITVNGQNAEDAAVAASTNMNLAEAKYQAALTARNIAQNKAIDATASAALAAGYLASILALALSIANAPVTSINGKTGTTFLDPIDVVGVNPIFDLSMKEVGCIPQDWFSRVGSGRRLRDDGIVELVSTNVPRVDFDGNGNPLGTMFEPSITNQVLYSEQFDDATWLKFNTTVIANAAIAPDGTMTADKLIGASGGPTNRYCGSSAATGTSLVYSGSVYAKAGEYSRFRLNVSNFSTDSRGATFDLAAATFSLEAAGTDYTALSAGMVPVGRGWWRCWIGATKGTANSTTRLTIDVRNNSSAATGDGTSGMFFWGAQLEVSSVMTSYISTINNTATRAADLILLRTADWFTPNGFCGMVEFQHVAGQTPGYFARVLHLSDNTYNNCFSVFGNLFTQMGISTAVGGVGANVPATYPYLPAGLNRISFRVSPTDQAFSLNGATPLTGSLLNGLPPMTQMEIGCSVQGSQWNRPISRVLLFPRGTTALVSNTTLQRMSSL